MAITITHHPNGLALAKNPVLFAGQTDNLIESVGTKQYAAFLLFDNCDDDFTIKFSFPNKLGNNTTERNFSINGFDSYGPPADLINDYFVPYVVNVLAADSIINQFYNVTYLALSSESIVLIIEAKAAGTLYNFDILVNFSGFGGGEYDISEPGIDAVYGLFSMEDATDIVYRDNLVVQCSILLRNMTDNTWKEVTKLKCIPSSDAGSFLFNFSGVLQSALDYTTAFIKPMPAEYKQFGLFKFVFDELIAGVPQNNIYFHELYSILGASPQPNRKYNTDKFFSGVKHPFLTNMPSKTKFGRDVYFVFGFMLGNVHSKANVYYKLTLDATEIQSVSESKDAEIKPFFFKFSQTNYAAAYEDLMNLEADLLESDFCKLTIFNEHYAETATATPENQLELIIDLKKHRNNNYFLFTNALGSTDVAWLNGELEFETEIEGTKIEFQPVLDPDFQQPQFAIYNKKGTHRFKINTGFKSIAEIQWLLELVYSESVLWAPLKIWRNLIAVARNTVELEDIEGPIPIIIDKQSINYHKSNDMVNSFSFEFEIAADNYAPHLNLI